MTPPKELVARACEFNWLESGFGYAAGFSSIGTNR